VTGAPASPDSQCPPAGWLTEVPQYAQALYQGVYGGVDLVYHGSQQQPEYDFRVAPGADPGVIELDVQGADRLEIDGAGDLVLDAGGREVRQHRPVLYQQGDGGSQSVAGGFFRRSRRTSRRSATRPPWKPT
jgi:hypothetical protein